MPRIRRLRKWGADQRLLARRTNNQFVAHRVPVKDHVKAGENSLILTFSSAFRKVQPEIPLRFSATPGSLAFASGSRDGERAR